MKQNILCIGLDVDNTQYDGSAFNQDTGEALDFKCVNQHAKLNSLSSLVFGLVTMKISQRSKFA